MKTLISKLVILSFLAPALANGAIKRAGCFTYFIKDEITYGFIDVKDAKTIALTWAYKTPNAYSEYGSVSPRNVVETQTAVIAEQVPMQGRYEAGGGFYKIILTNSLISIQSFTSEGKPADNVKPYNRVACPE